MEERFLTTKTAFGMTTMSWCRDGSVEILRAQTARLQDDKAVQTRQCSSIEVAEGARRPSLQGQKDTPFLARGIGKAASIRASAT